MRHRHNNYLSNIFQVFIPQTLVGLGAIKEIANVVLSLGASNVIVVTDCGLSEVGLLDRVLEHLKLAEIKYAIFTQCEPNAPLDSILQCVELVNQESSDAIIGLGGGSVMDTAKLTSLWVSTGQDVRNFVGVNKIEPHHTKLPKILIPTTAGSGAEWSQNAVFLDRESGNKSSMSSSFLMAQKVIIDPEFMAELPATITAETGVDALSHAIEAYTAIKASMISDMFAEQVFSMLPSNLLAAFASRNQNVEARYMMALASSLGLAAGMSTGGGGVLGHGMAYPLRDMASIPVSHGLSVSILLPHIMEFQLISNLNRFSRIAELMGERIEGLSSFDAAMKSIEAVRNLSIRVGLPQRMRDVGIDNDLIPMMVESMFELRAVHAQTSCRPASREDVRRIYEAAW